MKSAVYYDATGTILYATGVLSGIEPRPAADGEFLVLCDDVISSEHYVNKDGVVCRRPECPAPDYRFDTAQEAWVLDLVAKANRLRMKRAAELQASDWTQLPDVPDAQKAAWADYRQTLRDVPQQPGFPADIVWPEPPV